MLENPASDLVRSFLGKHAPGGAVSAKIETFMRPNAYRVRKDRGVLECAEMMARNSVDTLLVTDEADHYLGVVTIRGIKLWGKGLPNIETLIVQKPHTARIGDEAKESVDYLLESGDDYVVVLNANDTIAGIVTKTSVAKSVATTLWGDER